MCTQETAAGAQLDVSATLSLLVRSSGVSAPRVVMRNSHPRLVCKHVKTKASPMLASSTGRNAGVGPPSLLLRRRQRIAP